MQDLFADFLKKDIEPEKISDASKTVAGLKKVPVDQVCRVGGGVVQSKVPPIRPPPPYWGPGVGCGGQNLIGLLQPLDVSPEPGPIQFPSKWTS